MFESAVAAGAGVLTAEPTESSGRVVIPLISASSPVWGVGRRGEPVTAGIPLPQGVLRSTAQLRLEVDGRDRPLQVRMLDSWPDGSCRWVLVDFQADADIAGALSATLVIDGEAPASPSAPRLHVRQTPGRVEVDTDRAVFTFARCGSFPLSAAVVDGVDVLDSSASGLQIKVGDRVGRCVIEDVSVFVDGPLRAEIDLSAAIHGPRRAASLDVRARVEMFAGSATIRIHIAVRNPRRARHARGQWPLGDPGSVLLDGAHMILATRDHLETVQAAVEHGETFQQHPLPFAIRQESSGGQLWNSPAHCNRNGDVPLRFCGYQLSAGDMRRDGRRAAPIVAAHGGATTIMVAVPQFWENFPRTITVTTQAIDIGLFPTGAADLHELQGGEQKTHTLVVSFAPDRVADPPLAWSHDPLRFQTPPAWACAAAAVPFLQPVREDPETGYASLVASCLDETHGFFAKRERFDEFGWRHFGDLPADHESAFQTADRALISHYNNQYDAVAGFGIQYLRSGDVRWWRLMNDLAHHVRDIDIYHTARDKAAYNGGLFWHTYHYMDAGTSTHRTYPAGMPGGGGPSAEHNYTTGLMLHYFLTGDRASREAAIGLARWVLAMDDGRQSRYGYLASGPTGHASATGSPDYHGPGRGAANSIIACRNAYRLTGENVFARKADELIRRCVHPQDDLQTRNLLDVERRWFYTVFLQALGAYLHEKQACGELDEMYDYAQSSLLHYARWMLDHERPYLERPDLLEFPTETWAAQDLRKAEVLWWAALHARDTERDRFLTRARGFFDESINTLSSMPTRHFTRPLVLLLSNGVRAGWFRHRHVASAAPRARARHEHAMPPQFRPQKSKAVARLKWVAASVVTGAVLAGLIALL